MFDSEAKELGGKKIIINDLVRIIKKISTEWEMEFVESIGPNTLLGEDLALKSIDVVRLLSAIQELYKQQDFPFEELLLRHDNPVKDISISDLAEFLFNHINYL